MAENILNTERDLREAARTALAAPSIFNTQPWRWQIDRATLRLWADHSRQLIVADPEGRLLTVSCGVALHHALIALAVAGHGVRVRRMPELSEPDLLAEIELSGEHRPDIEQLRGYAAIPRRRTDRRAFTSEPVSNAIAARLRKAAESQGAHLYLVPEDQVSTLAHAATQVAAMQLSDPAYRVELAGWTHRPPWSGDGVLLDSAVTPAPRPVPVRQFSLMDEVPDPGPEHDRGARYAVVFTNTNSPQAWLQAGEALSAVLLAATDEGLGTAPISDVTEMSVTREELRRLLSGIGYPQLAVRVGHAPPGEPPMSPRRRVEDAITFNFS